MLGIFALAGMIGTPIVVGKILKNDIQAETIDNKFKPLLNQQANKNNIKRNFTDICKRCNIQISKNGKPVNKKQCRKGKEYLAYRGYDDNAIRYFEILFFDYYNKEQNSKRAEINNRHQELLHKFEKSKKPKVLIIYRRNYYSNNNIEKRMNKIYTDTLWNKIVKHHTYIKGKNYAKYVEVWTLEVPKNFFNNIKIDTIYEDICYKLNIEDGNF